MKKQLQAWKLIINSLQLHIPVMLLYVLESEGSSPGRQGFFMAVNTRGEMEGSIGGGIMEHKFVEMAKDKLRQDEDELSVRRQVHDKSAAKNQSGMICSGEQTILLYRVHENDAESIQHIIATLEQHTNAILQLSPQGIAFSADVPGQDYSYTYTSDTDWLYTEKLGYKQHIYIIGGGHCSLALSRLMSMLNFYVHVYDDRINLKTLDENEHAHEKATVNDYSELTSLIPSNTQNYIVVMTFGYRTDDIAVRALLDKHFRYFGLLGSKSKIEKMFAAYIAAGIPENVLQHIHAPVGLNIHSQTPEEIAVSIAAEIIAVKNGVQRLP